MASLQLNQTHVCGAGMFKIGFLISTAKCINEIDAKIKEGQESSAVLGNRYLTEGTRHLIVNYATHPYYKVYDFYKRNYDAGVVMVGWLNIFFVINLVTNGAYEF